KSRPGGSFKRRYSLHHRLPCRVCRGARPLAENRFATRAKRQIHALRCLNICREIRAERRTIEHVTARDEKGHRAKDSANPDFFRASVKIEKHFFPNLFLRIAR